MLIESGGGAGRGRRLPADTVPLTAGLSLTAGLIHAVMSAGHFEEAFLFGCFFVAAAVFQITWGVALYRSDGRAWLRTGALVNLGVVLVWLLSRTVGLPIGPEPWTPESVGVVDVVVGVDELLLAGLALGVLAPRRVARRLAVGATWAAGSACVLSLTALLVAGGHYH